MHCHFHFHDVQKNIIMAVIMAPFTLPYGCATSDLQYSMTASSSRRAASSVTPSPVRLGNDTVQIHRVDKGRHDSQQHDKCQTHFSMALHRYCAR